MDELTRLPVIDGHFHFTHIEQMPDVAKLAQTAQVTRFNLLSMPDAATVNHNAALLYFKTHHPGLAFISGALDYSTCLGQRDRMSGMLAEQIHTLKAIGFDGLKLIESKPTSRPRFQIPLDAPEYEGMWAALEQLRFPVLWHVADPEEFWDAEKCPDWARKNGWFYAEGDFPTKEGLYSEVDHVLARHPALKIIFAHFFFLSADLERAARFFDAHPTVCFDLTPGVEMYHNFSATWEATRAFFLRYQDRIVYGTDNSTGALGRQDGVRHAENLVRWVRAFLEHEGSFEPSAMDGWLARSLAGLRGLGLPQEVLAKIYRANFERQYGSQPAPLNRAAALAEVSRLAGVIEAQTGGREKATSTRRVEKALKK